MRWYVAARKQYDHQFGPYEFYFAGNFVPVHPRHLEVEEHCIALARCHKSECLLPGRCSENCVSRLFEQRFLVAQDRFVIINAQNGFLRRGISRDQIGLLPTSGRESDACSVQLANLILNER